MNILSNMLPRSSAYNAVNLADCNVKLVGKRLHGDATRSIAIPDCLDRSFCELGVGKLFALGLSLFFYLISIVVALSAEKQVIGSNTSRIVATMQDVQSIGDRAIMQFPGNSMGQQNNSGIVTLKINPPISPVHYLTSPIPAPVVAFAGFAPESFAQGFHVGRIQKSTSASQNNFVLSVITGEDLVNLIVALVVMGLVWWLLYWLVSYLAPPEPFAKVAKVILAVAAVLILINLLMGLTGHPLVVWRVK